MRYLIIFILLLAGCSQPETLEDLKQFVREQEKKPAAPIPPAKEFTSYKPFVYSVANLRSPFAPPVTPVIASLNNKTGVKPDLTRTKQFLENFVIDDLKVVGFLHHNRHNYGLIQHEESVYKVRVGDYLGKDYGKITEITEQGIRVMEIVSSGHNAWMKRPLFLEIQR